MKKQIFTILGLLIFFGLFAQEIPQKISYQGKLLEDGYAVTGIKNFTFTIGAWSETHSNVQVTDGLYSVTLGETTSIPLSIFNNSSSLSLQISVEGTNLTSTSILSVPYAYKAEKAVEAENVPTDNSELTNGAGYITSPNDADADPTNELITNGTLNGTDLEITDAGGTTIVDLSSLSGLTLPYNGTYSSGSAEAFRIENYGTGGGFQLYNDASADWGVYISNYSNNDAFIISNSGTGRSLSVTNSSSGGDGNPSAYFHILEPTNNDAVIYAATNGGGYAGYFSGDVNITGTLTGGKSYAKIDHPLDPENKYLYHSFIESPDMMNVYNGNIVLDKNGEAIIELPIYFEALNMEFRYQLTCIGGYAPVYVAKEISDNSFKISGGKEGMKISWQVTGVRQDPYANQNRIPVEVEKTEKEKGHYLHYKEYNQPIEKSIEVVNNPKLLKEFKEQNMEGKK